MAHDLRPKHDAEKAADLIRDSGGKIVGRTRLQKLAYFLELAGLGGGFTFEYRHYGPYSEALASATQAAKFLDLLDEVEHPTSWGGTYSIFTSRGQSSPTDNDARLAIARLGVKADPIELELAATAAFLAAEGSSDPWTETARRKPEKAEGNRLANAKALYAALRGINTPKPLPSIA